MFSGWKVSKDSCFGVTYRAEKTEHTRRKGFSETATVFCTCQQVHLLRAVDVLKGETFRRAHYLPATPLPIPQR